MNICSVDYHSRADGNLKMISCICVKQRNFRLLTSYFSCQKDLVSYCKYGEVVDLCRASYLFMNTKNLYNIVSLGEGFTVEFKEAGTSKIGRELCAFTNATGGSIFIGVTDDGNIKGILGHDKRVCFGE